MGWFNKLRRTPKHMQKSYTTFQLNPYFSFKTKWSQYTNAEALDAYRRTVWLYSCLRLRADNISAVPWIVEQRKGDEWEQTEDHELAELLDRPNRDMDLKSMIKMAMYWLDLTGDSWGSKVRDGSGRVREWWPLLPDQMRVEPGRDRLIENWKYRKGSKSAKLPAEDVMHFRYTAPGDVYFGLSPLQAAAKSVDIDQEASKFQKVSLQNHGMPPGVFEGPEDLSPQQYEQAQQWIEDQSGAERARKPWVLGGFKFHSMAQTPHELDFLESRKHTREEICAAYAVPPPLVGIYDNATLANIQTSRRIFWLEGLIPVLRELESQFNLQLAREYGRDVRITYDISNVEALSEDDTAKIERASKLWGMGIPLTEINRILELGLDTDAIPGADVGYLPSGLLPADFDLEGDAEQGGNDVAADAYGDDDG